MKKFFKLLFTTCLVLAAIFIGLEIINAILDGANEALDELLAEGEGGYSYNPPGDASSSQAQEQIRIVNNTGYTIWHMYITPSSTDRWGNDILGFRTLGRNEEFTYRLPHPLSRENRYDIRLEDGSGDEFVKMHVRVSDNERIVFTIDDLDYYEGYAGPQPIAQQPSQGGTQQPAQQPTTQPTTQPAPVPQTGDQGAIRSAIVSAAQRYLGATYMLGAQSPPSRFDCSGLINQAYRDGANMVIPRSSAEMWTRGTRINRNQLQPGDIIVYSSNGGRTTTHVSLVMSASEMIHAVSAGTPRGVIRQSQSSGSWPGQEIGYVRFVGVPVAVTRNVSKGMALTELLIDITPTLSRATEELSVLTGSALSFVMTNMTGSDDQFDIFFYKEGRQRSSGETEFIWIPDGEIEESKAFLCEEAGRYRLEIARRADGRALIEYTYNVED